MMLENEDGVKRKQERLREKAQRKAVHRWCMDTRVSSVDGKGRNGTRIEDICFVDGEGGGGGGGGGCLSSKRTIKKPYPNDL